MTGVGKVKPLWCPSALVANRQHSVSVVEVLEEECTSHCTESAIGKQSRAPGSGSTDDVTSERCIGDAFKHDGKSYLPNAVLGCGGDS